MTCLKLDTTEINYKSGLKQEACRRADLEDTTCIRADQFQSFRAGSPVVKDFGKV